MSLLQLPVPIIGQTGNYPYFKFLVSTADYATFTAAGYLNKYTNAISYPLANGDMLFAFYNASLNASTGAPSGGTFGIFSVSVSNAGVITASEYTSSSGVNCTSLPSVVGSIANYSNTTGDIGTNTGVITTPGNIQAGEGNTAGRVIAYAGFPGTNRMIMKSGGGVAGTDAIIQNDQDLAQTTTYTIPDPGVAATNFVLENGAATMGTGSMINLFQGTGTVSGGAVIINQQKMLITTASLSTAAGDSLSFTLNNTLIGTNSQLLITVAGGTNSGSNQFCVSYTGLVPGAATIILTNTDSTIPFNGTFILSVVVV